MEFIWILVRWLFPCDGPRQVAMVAHDWIARLMDWIEDEACWFWLHDDPEICMQFESSLLGAEDLIRMVIEGRARQIAGLGGYAPYLPRVHRPVRARTPMELFHILARVTVLHANIEHHAHKRAERLMRERERNPLGLAETVVEYFGRIFSVGAVSSLAFGEADGMARRSAAKAAGGWPHCSQIGQRVRAPP